MHGSRQGGGNSESLSVVIPVYNAELTLSTLSAELVSALEDLSPRFEVVLVDDGSRDRSWEIICALVDKDPRIRGIRLSRNYGQHSALLCGIHAVRHEVIVTMDDDLQHPVSELASLLGKLAEGYDVVYGSLQPGQHGLLRNLASTLTKLALQSAMGAETARHTSALRAFRTRLRDGFEDYQSPFVSIDVLLTWTTSHFGHVEVRHEPRRAGVSNYSVRKLITHAFNLMTGFSTLPLQLASMVGFAAMVFGLGVLVWVVGRYFVSGSDVQGFPFLASIIAIFSGVQLFSLGVFGEYLARMHFRSMGRPAYVVGGRYPE